MANEQERKELMNEAKTLRFSLTRKDRKFLRAYLGFEKIIQIPERIPKRKAEACYFVRRSLWTKKKKKNNGSKQNEKEEGEEEEKEEEEEEEEEEEGGGGEDEENEEEGEQPFDLREMMTKNIPRIFNYSIDDLQNLLSESYEWRDFQQVSFIR